MLAPADTDRDAVCHNPRHLVQLSSSARSDVYLTTVIKEGSRENNQTTLQIPAADCACHEFKKFTKTNGLSEDLIWGSKDVLGERVVILKLMTRCENISKKMTKAVTKVTSGDKSLGTISQPSILSERLQLKPYQLIGLNWLTLLHKNKLSGILADEMHVHCKALSTLQLQRGLNRKPLSHLNAATEPSQTFKKLFKIPIHTARNCAIYAGSVQDRKYLRYNILNKTVDFNIIVSTYSLTISNADDRSLFRRLKLHYAIFDEGHMLKNMSSLRYKHLMTINHKSGCRMNPCPSLPRELLEELQLEQLEEGEPLTPFCKRSNQLGDTLRRPQPSPGLLTFYIGSTTRGFGAWPLSPVAASIASLVQGPHVALFSKDVLCPNKQCKVTEAMLRKAYAAEALATWLGNYTSILVAYQSSPCQRTLEELRLVTDHLLQLYKYNGRGLAAVIAARRQLWLSQARVSDGHKASLLDISVTPGHTFGPAVDKLLLSSQKARESTKELVCLLPKKALQNNKK
ncbi:UNVERIFIED_CONTAM: hypothetical protein FKN15_076662 [Acipenser sinensis]